MLGLHGYFDRSVRIAMNIVEIIQATVDGWYVNMVKAYVRYGKFTRNVLPIRHGYVMICNDAGVLSYGTAAVWKPVGKYVSPAPNRHEWLIRRENVK